MPILFVNSATFENTIAKIDDREQVYVRATGYEPKAGRHLVVPKADGTLAGVLFGIEAADEPVRICFCPGGWPALCRTASIALPMRRMTRGWRRSLSRSALTASRAIARRKRATVRLDLPQSVDREEIERIVEGGDAGARSHQHAGERHGPGRTRRGRAQRLPRGTARRSTSSSATSCLPRIFR